MRWASRRLGGQWLGDRQVAPKRSRDGDHLAECRRSGGNTSVLERAPDGLVYCESGPTFLKLQGGRAIPGYSFPQKPRSGFWLAYFAFGPNGAVYADEIPGFGALGRSISSFASFTTADLLCSGNRHLPLWLRLRPEAALELLLQAISQLLFNL